MFLALMLLLATGCHKKRSEPIETAYEKDYDLVIGFGSCNNQHMENPLWESLALNDPELFIWGGDIVYSDTEDMNRMRKAYAKLKHDPAYIEFASKREVTGTWDDHDYGLNDGGREYPMKDSVQQILLDFLDVPKTDPRRIRQGVYHSHELKVDDKRIKVIVLDTRYFRSGLRKDPTGEKRYVPTNAPESTILGAKQWDWLKGQLEDSEADFHIIVSSIQMLSSEHGFESWGNMPEEVDRFFSLLSETKPKGALVLSGDRHIAEISKREIPGLAYPLFDFTSSGMTHSYTSFEHEDNPFRVSKVVPDKNFGLLKFDLVENSILMEIRGEENALYVQELVKFPK